MPRHPEGIQRLIDHFSRLPTIGPKTAERLVFYLLTQDQDSLENFSDSMARLKGSVSICTTCFNVSETNPCAICLSSQRNRSLVCVVAKPQDLAAVERTSEYNGRYHVLGGLIDPLRGITPEQLTVNALLARLQDNSITEIILALSSDMPGETTVMYLTRLLKPRKVRITRLAQGLPSGSDLEYADEITLSSALKGRREV